MQSVVGVFGEVGVEGVGAVDAGVVVFDDRFKGRKATVMHVGRGQFDVAQRWRFESTFVAVAPRHGGAAPVEAVASRQAVSVRPLFLSW